MKNAQKPEKVHLGKLISDIQKGHFVIPDFQREFAWKPWDVRDLVQSVFMDYYIGTLLLWETTKKNLDTLVCEGLYGFENKLTPEYIVLDGQQRLTALHYAFFAPDKPFPNRAKPILYWIKIPQLLAGDLEDAFFYHSATKYYQQVRDSLEHQYEEHLFPMRVLGEGSWGVSDWVKGYRDYWRERAETATDSDEVNKAKRAANTAEDLKNIFEDLLDNYQVSYIALDKDIDVGKVCDIFTHINSRGVKLDIFDLLNAITRPNAIFLKQMYREASEELVNYYDVGTLKKTYILMVMSMIAQNYCSPKYLYYLVPQQEKVIRHPDGKKESIVLVESSGEFIDRWNYALQALKRGLAKLKNARDYGAINDKLLPYPSIAPAFASILDYALTSSKVANKADTHYKIKRWYWSSVLGSRYSSSAESTSTRDYIAMKRWFADDDATPDSVQEFEADFSRLDLIGQTSRGAATYIAIFNLFIIEGAKDWSTFELPEYDDLDDHHIVPKSWGKKNKLVTEINSVLNRSPLTPDTNRKVIRDRLPNDYLAEIFKDNDSERVYQVLDTHLISRTAVDILLRDPFTPEDYTAFLAERQRTIKRRLRLELLQADNQVPEDLRQYDRQISTVELELRDLIKDTLKLAGGASVEKIIPSHLVPKLKGRMGNEAKKNPALHEEMVDTTDYWLQFLDLQELKDTIVAKALWPNFEARFVNKAKLADEFADLGALRNAIRHDRTVDEVTERKGQGAIAWFQSQLK